jgi:heptosyltransferase II
MLKTVTLNPSAISKVMVRATNWLGDAVMSLPAIRSIGGVFPKAHLTVVARPGVADLYARESAIHRVIPYPAHKGLAARRAFARSLRAEGFECAILLQNAFDAALMAWFADIPLRIGYRRDGRGFLLTHPVPPPGPGDIPRHERFYYLELLRRAGLIEHFPDVESIRLDGADEARQAGTAQLAALGVTARPIGVSPGAAYGSAKRWPAASFAESACRLAVETGAPVLVFGSSSESGLCGEVARAVEGCGIAVRNMAGQTTLREFIDLAAACRLLLTNDSGAMHVASALGVPTIAVFGATDDIGTGPTGPLARVVREHAECSPCLLRECPIDHRCMTRVTPDRVCAEAALLLETAWTHEAKS